MNSYRQLVQQASAQLKAHPLGKLPQVLHLWQGVEWQEMASASPGKDAEASQKEMPVIRLYPDLLRQEGASFPILREFGEIVKAKGGQRATYLWSHKLDLPTPSQVDQIQEKLDDEGLRQTCQTYRQVLDSYPPQGTAVDRLVFIHVANALLANNIPYPDSMGVAIRHWGPCVEYCHQKRYHSLIPLISHYSPPRVYEMFGEAFATLLLGLPDFCQESSTAEGLRRIIRNVVHRLDPYPDVG